MPAIHLSTLALLLGAAFSLLNLYGVLKPGEFSRIAREFPRNVTAGYVLMLISTGWFLANVSREQVSDFASFKPALYVFFGCVGVGACFYVTDYLAVRGLAVFFLLLAKWMVDSARWVDTEWRLVIVVWAYVLAVAGMWFTVSPWRLRDFLNWAVATQERVRFLSAVRLGFGLLVLILALTVYRSAEHRSTALLSFPSFAAATGLRPWL